MSEQANTIAAAEVSSEYLSDIRLRVRSSVDKLDGEIKDLILAAVSYTHLTLPTICSV